MISNVALKLGAGLLLVVGIGSSGVLVLKKGNPTNLGEKLSSAGTILLNTDRDSHIHKKEWEEIVKVYEASDNNNKIDSLSLTAPSGDGQKQTENINQLKEKCKKLFDSPIQEDGEFTKKEKLAKNWCVVDATKNKVEIQ